VSTADWISAAAVLVAAATGGYAVVISRRTLAWQQERDREQAEAKVSVSFGHATALRFGDERDDDELYYELTINIVNEGQSPEFLKTLWVEPNAGGCGVDYSPTSDVELRPRSRWPVRIDAADIPQADDGFVAIVHLANGQAVRSSVERLIDGMLDETPDALL
jgi:hypothetical protein